MKSIVPCVILVAFAWPAEARQGAQAGGGQQDEAKAETSQKKDAKKKKDPERGFHWDEHPSLRLGPGTRVDFRMRIQADVSDSDAPLPGEDGAATTVDFARRRASVEGEILNLFDYQVEYEIGADQDAWRDVYVNYKQFRFAEAQGGLFKLPFSMDANTSPTNLDFVYRSMAADLLAPGRDPGVMVHGRTLARQILRYELGVFSHDGRNARTHNAERVHGDRTIAGRVTVQPFRSTKSIMRDLSFGAAFTSSDVPEGIPDLRGRTLLDAGFYRPAVFVNGMRRRTGLEARWRPGPFSIKSEYIRLTNERLGESVEDTDLSPFLATGWYVSGTWAITGEDKSNGLDSPRRPLFRGGFGAVEVAARIERVTFGSVATDGVPSTSPRADVILGNSDRLLTFGVNWYPNRWIKVQLNTIRETIADPSQGPMPSRATFWNQVFRFQFSL